MDTSTIISLIIVFLTFTFLISEKINKVVVVMLGAILLILTQVFVSPMASSQEMAFEFISKNLDVLGFIVGMMVLIGIIQESGFFESIAIRFVKGIKGNPRALVVILAILTFCMTVFLENISTILILVPITLILIKQLKLPYLPYLFVIVSVANVAGSATPISDPSTYYQAKVVGLSFGEVISNAGVIAVITAIITVIYTLIIFKKSLEGVSVNKEDVALFKPESAIKDKKRILIGLPLLILAIGLIIGKDYLKTQFGIALDNASIMLGAGFLAILIFKIDMKTIFNKIIDWEMIFFFIGLFIIIGSLEYTGVIHNLANWLVEITSGAMTMLTFVVTMGSSVISILINNVPYNITMVSAIQSMAKSGVDVYPLWWALNLGTSIGGAGSIIGATCNVIAFSLAEKEGLKVNFLRYMLIAIPLVLINGLIAFLIIWVKYLR